MSASRICANPAPANGKPTNKTDEWDDECIATCVTLGAHVPDDRLAAWRKRYPATVGRQAAPVTEVTEDDKAKLTEFSFKRLTWEEFAVTDYHTEYLIDGVLVRGQPCVIAGARKCLKTSVLVDMAISLATGTRFLGTFPVSKNVRVGIMSGESGAATLQETARRIALARDVAPRPGLFWSFELPKFSNKIHIEALKQFIEADKLDVLLIDPAYLCMTIGDSAGNMFVVGEQLAPITELGQRTGCTISIAMHNTKASSRNYDPPDLDDISWSGFAEWARQWIILGRREPFNPESDSEHKLWLSVGGSAGHHGLWGLDIVEGRLTDLGGRRWEVVVTAGMAAKDGEIKERERQKEESNQKRYANRQARLRDKIMAVVRNSPSGETESKIRSRAGINSEAFGPVMEALRAEGVVEVCEVVARNKQRYDGWRLAANHSDTRTHSDGLGQKTPSD